MAVQLLARALQVVQRPSGEIVYVTVYALFNQSSLIFPQNYIYSLHRVYTIAVTLLARRQFSMSELPKMMKAIKVVDIGKAELREVPLPRMRDDYILVKVHAVALNPTDW